MKEKLELLVSEMYRSGILYEEGVREFKKRFILRVLLENRQNQCKAAREMGMHRNTLPRTARVIGLQRVNGQYVDKIAVDSRKQVQGAALSAVKAKEA